MKHLMRSCNLPNTDPRSEVKQSKDEAEAGSAGGQALLLVFSLYI